MMPCVQPSANTQPSSSQPEVRTASGRLVRKPARFRDFFRFMLFKSSIELETWTDSAFKCSKPVELYNIKFLWQTTLVSPLRTQRREMSCDVMLGLQRMSKVVLLTSWSKKFAFGEMHACVFSESC